MIQAAQAVPEPFQVHVPQHELDDLQVRLGKTRFSAGVKAGGWEAGTSRAYLDELIGYWRSSYDWRAREAELNAFAHFKATVAGIGLHFMHERGLGLQPVPLLLLHGWPDSFYRFHKVIRMLARPAGGARDAGDAFDVVVPSLPGFAFTGPVKRPSGARHLRHDAELLWRLMTDELGYDRFMVAGGDQGSAIAQVLAIEHPDAVMGIHITDLGWHVGWQTDPASVSRKERKWLEAAKKLGMADGAYALVQTTRPQSLAVALNDSPVGLASWIVDRFHSWTDCTGDLEECAISRDEILTNIMIYWVTQTIGSSMLKYHAEAVAPSLTVSDRVERPVALALFPKEIAGIPPLELAERTLNVQRWTELPYGGHFAALESPSRYVQDIVEFSRLLRGVSQQPEPEVSFATPFI